MQNLAQSKLFKSSAVNAKYTKSFGRFKKMFQDSIV